MNNGIIVHLMTRKREENKVRPLPASHGIIHHAELETILIRALFMSPNWRIGVWANNLYRIRDCLYLKYADTQIRRYANAYR